MKLIEPTNFIEEEINKDLESGKAKEVRTKWLLAHWTLQSHYD